MKDPIQTLTAWLEKPVYTEGILHYEKLIGNDFLLTSVLKSGADAYNRDKLTQALSAKLDELLLAQKTQKESYPDSLVAELGTGGLLMDERTILKERMRTLYNSGITEGKELKKLAFRVLSIKDELDVIYGHKHFFEQHGFLPDLASAALPEAQTPEHILRRRNTVRTYVCKYEKELTEAYDPKRIKKVQKKLLQFKTELHDLDNHLLQLLPKPADPV